MATSTTTYSSPISSLMFDPGPSYYYNDAFRRVLEDHMSFLRTHISTTTIQVSPQAAWENDQDLFGFLQSINSPPYLHWVTMRLNDMTSPDQFGAATTILLLPGATILAQLLSAWMTTAVISS